MQIWTDFVVLTFIFSIHILPLYLLNYTADYRSQNSHGFIQDKCIVWEAHLGHSPPISDTGTQAFSFIIARQLRYFVGKSPFQTGKQWKGKVLKGKIWEGCIPFLQHFAYWKSHKHLPSFKGYWHLVQLCAQ